MPTAPAIINAIYDAVGVRITQLPATPERVMSALQEKRVREAAPIDATRVAAQEEIPMGPP